MTPEQRVVSDTITNCIPVKNIMSDLMSNRKSSAIFRMSCIGPNREVSFVVFDNGTRCSIIPAIGLFHADAEFPR